MINVVQLVAQPVAVAVAVQVRRVEALWVQIVVL
jgi:hypothetical protein